MDEVNVVFAGAKNYQSTVKPIFCTIIPLPTYFSSLKAGKTSKFYGDNNYQYKHFTGFNIQFSQY